MKTHHPFVRALLLSVLMGTLVASVALAKTGGLGFIRLSAAGDVASSCPSPTPSPSPSESPSPSPSPSESPSPGESPSSDQGDQDEQGDQNEQGTSDDHESDDQGTSDQQESDDCKDEAKDEGTDQGTPKPSPSADREKACMEAAGMSTDSTAAGTAGTPQVKTTGLDHAIEMVLANCIKNPQAPGLLNALRHLVANRESHAAHDDEKAARKASHEAEKAAREAAKADKGHGH